MNKPFLSILIPTYNRSDLLERTLESLAQLVPVEGVGIELIVVANACTDDTIEVAERGFQAIPFPSRVVDEQTPGLNPARTRAVEESRGEVCALLDDDVWLDTGWIRSLYEAFQDEAVDIVGGRVDLWWEEIEQPAWLPEIAYGLLSANQLGDEVKTLNEPWGIIGANFAFRRAMFDRIGGFKPGLDRVGNQLMGAGESEFVQRALLNGSRVIYSPHVSVKHWVPEKRLTSEYLMGVSSGNGMSRVLMKPHLSLAGYARSFTGHLWLVLRHACSIPLAQLRKDRGALLTHRCRMAVGFGGLRGLRKRLAHRG